MATHASGTPVGARPNRFLIDTIINIEMVATFLGLKILKNKFWAMHKIVKS
jgi:hypothetical protein